MVRRDACGGGSNEGGIRWEERGQATIEAAALLPTLMLLFGILLQPACLLYTRAVMRGAAAEVVRVIGTSSSVPDEDCRDFVLRRLKAVPEVPLFHVGGRSDWDVSFERGVGVVTVSISGHLRPLPLLGITAAALGERDGAGVRLDVQVTERTRPTWLGGDYASWVSVWG